MPFSISRGPWSSGRGFAAMDPERVREVPGYVRSGPIQTAPTVRPAPRSARLDWMRMVPEHDSASFEGSSSRRGR